MEDRSVLQPLKKFSKEPIFLHVSRSRQHGRYRTLNQLELPIAHSSEANRRIELRTIAAIKVTQAQKWQPACPCVADRQQLNEIMSMNKVRPTLGATDHRVNFGV